MTVWKAKDRATYRYRFYIDGQLYRGNTKQITQADAEEWEAKEKRRIRRRLGGLSTLAEHSPRFAVWAGVYLKYLRQRGKVRRIDRIEELLRVVLRFWGAKPSGRDPKNPPVEGEPYHDLRLVDPIRDPEWIERFEEWIRRRKVYVGRDADGEPTYRPISAQTRLHYMSVMSRLYRLATRPRFKKQTGVLTNPFLDVERDRPAPREVTVTPAELRRWLQHTPKHAQLAIAIAALAPKLRLQNVLELRWDRSFDPAVQFITVLELKTVGRMKAPMVVAIGRALRRLLKVAQREATGPWVITYQDSPVKSIRHAVQTGAERAGLSYGRDVAGGVTFHTIRHTAATLLAEVPSLTEAQRSATMGQDIETTQRYTHLRPVSQRPVVNRLADKLKLDRVLEETFGKPESRSEILPRREGKKPVENRAKREVGDRPPKRRSSA
jgi:integrase